MQHRRMTTARHTPAPPRRGCCSTAAHTPAPAGVATNKRHADQQRLTVRHMAVHVLLRGGQVQSGCMCSQLWPRVAQPARRAARAWAGHDL
jgi:hypothetical protein